MTATRTTRNYWICQVAGWGAYSVMGAAGAAQQVGLSFSLVAAYALFFAYSIALTDLLRREMRRRGWLRSLSFTAVLRLFLAAVATAAIQAGLVVTIDFALHPADSFFLRRPSSFFILWASIAGADCMWIVSYASITLRRQREFNLQLALREAELRALEAQINPHFLFNCLNSIRALVIENPVLAQDMITRFAGILRYNLHRDPMHTVPLASEVEVVSDYLAIECVRFEDRLRVHLEIEPEAGLVPVPPMMLQTLVENAIKHGIAQLPAGGDITIRARLQSNTLLVEVENTGQLTEPETNSIRVGVNNTRERLRLMYGGGAGMSLENRGEHRVVASILVPTNT